jgi:ketosteroid isomerase-like protein
VDAFAALYAEDVRVFDMWGAWAYEGLPAWRAMAQGWFGSLGDEKVGVEFAEVRTLVGDELATLSAFVTYRGLAADGTELRAMNNRVTMTFRRQGGAWKIVHEHSSSPADIDTMKVRLSRS